MTLVLLLAATLVALALPMLPAIVEWRRPSDAAPLVIEAGHALDPAGFAGSFRARLADALARGEGRLGRSALAHAGGQAACGDWPLTRAEVASGCSHRVWHVPGDALLPPGQAFLAEVACGGSLQSTPGSVCRALLGAQRVSLAERTVVLRWVHGDEVEVSRGCWLAGRVSAARSIVVDGQVRFTMLHAPVVRFGAGTGDAATDVAAAASAPDAPPDGVAWDGTARRGVADGALSIPAGRAWRGDLVCRGVLRLGPGCHAQGSLKSHGALGLAAGCRVDGSIVAHGLVRLNRDCTVLGAVVSETAVTIGAGCVVGAPGRPATVTAPRIVVAAGAVVHGTLWATDDGAAGCADEPTPAAARPAPAWIPPPFAATEAAA